VRRFYRNAVVAERGGGFAIALDGKPVRTPAKADLILPTRALAEAVADEWQGQGDDIRPQSMCLTRLASTGIDRVGPQREAVIEEIAAYAATDLVCYRAEGPWELTKREDAAWRPLLDWAARRYRARLRVAAGVVPLDQSPAPLQRLKRAAAAMDDMTLTGLHHATAACGSLVIGLALAEGHIDAARALELSLVDETFQIERWGEDGLQARRRENLRQDIASAARFMELCRR
jgi:chaperone required for assembly of F1-ATPase